MIEQLSFILFVIGIYLRSFQSNMKQRELYIQPCSHLYQSSLMNIVRSMKYQLCTLKMKSCGKSKMLDI